MESFRTRSLFKQFVKGAPEDLDEWRKRYVACADPTEYAGGVELLGSWADWQKFKRLWPYFTDNILPEWKEEVEIMLRSQAVKSLCAQSKTDNGSAAAKWIAEGKYNVRQAGRPSKEEVRREARIAAGVKDEAEEDISRVMSELRKEQRVN